MIFTLFVFLGLSGTALAGLIPINEHAKDNGKAPDNSPVITQTGSGEWDLVRVDFIHYAKPESPAKPPKGPKAAACYKLLGPKWKSLPVSYVINPAGSSLDESFVASAISAGAEEWDNWTGVELFDDSYGISSEVAYGSQDFVNAMSFGDYPSDGVIAVTSVWYTLKGRQIVEFDILFDTDYTWGDATVNPALMDLQNIATHEIGHGAGLDDLYQDTCSEETMFGYSENGEVKKRDLNSGDIAGIQRLYGN